MLGIPVLLVMALMAVGTFTRRAASGPDPPIIAGLLAGLIIAVLVMATSAVVDNAFLAVVSHQLLVGLRKDLKIDVLTEAFAGTGQIGFLGWLRADALVARASASDITVRILQCASAPRTGCRPRAPPPGGKRSGAGAFRVAPGVTGSVLPDGVPFEGVVVSIR